MLSALSQAESVTLASDRFNRFQGLLWVKLKPESAYKDFEDIAVPIIILCVKMLSQFCFRNDLPRMHHQIFEQFILVGSEVYIFTADRQPFGRQVERERTKVYSGFGKPGCSAQMSKSSA